MVENENWWPNNSPNGTPLRKKPTRKIIAARRTTCHPSFPRSSPFSFRFANEKVMATPTIQRKNGKIVSV